MAYWGKRLPCRGFAMIDQAEAVVPAPAKTKFDIAEIGAIAHLYRGEVYRSTVWRTRLDQTTNWAVVTRSMRAGSSAGSCDRSQSICTMTS